ncbi:MAG: hypothetical protein GX799_12170 [Crenarchaeota archaeon]|jgi:hypothetical protein|nr:hypothetical protein [Thermoproteota archaeon]
MNRNKIVCMVFLLAIFITTGEISTVQPSYSSTQAQAQTFIENVLPIDSSKYNITLRNYGVPSLPDINVDKQNDRLYDGNEEVLTYSLDSKDSSIDVICHFNDGNLYICYATTRKGEVITDKAYANVADAAKSFLEKYQAYSKLDSTEMMAMLENVDATKNATITSKDLTLTITHKDLRGTFFGDSINFRWVRIVNGCEYLLMDVAFSDGAFAGFTDHRTRYSIGDTTVNISKEEAIAIAMNYIKNYSYRMSDNLVISDFNVTEDKTVAILKPTMREDNILYPHWSVTLYLNQTYPGSVTSILLGIWADTGEVFFCHYQAYGGSGLPSDANSNSQPSNDNSVYEQLPSSENNEVSSNTNQIILVAVITTVIAVLAIAIVVKKRSK